MLPAGGQDLCMHGTQGSKKGFGATAALFNHKTSSSLQKHPSYSGNLNSEMPGDSKSALIHGGDVLGRLPENQPTLGHHAGDRHQPAAICAQWNTKPNAENDDGVCFSLSLKASRHQHESKGHSHRAVA